MVAKGAALVLPSTDCTGVLGAELQWEHQSNWKTGAPQGNELFLGYTETPATPAHTTWPLQPDDPIRQIKTLSCSALRIPSLEKQTNPNDMEINFDAKPSNWQSLLTSSNQTGLSCRWQPQALDAAHWNVFFTTANPDRALPSHHTPRALHQQWVQLSPQ